MATSVSSVSNHFPSAENGFTTTTSGSVSSGATTVGLNSVAGYANGEIVVFIIDPDDTTKKQTFTGTMDTAGSQVTGVVWTAGTNQAHSAGATVVDYASATHISMISKGILVQHKQDGTHANTITTDTINENTAANGVMIDGVNIKDSALNTNNSVVTNNITDLAVSTAKIDTDAVTDAKLVYGKLRTRQGGSSTNWGTAGTTAYDYSATNTFWQTGESSGDSGADVTITFSTAFNQVPNVVATVTSVATANCYVVIASRTATTFVFRCIDAAGTQRSEEITWIAIGE